MFLSQSSFPGANLTPTGPSYKWVYSEKRQIEDMVMSTAKRYHIRPELLVRIAMCESGLRIDARNPSSTASGIFQFLNSTFFNYTQAYELPMDNKNDPLVQAELAARMIADGKISAWNASKSCWHGY